MYYLSIWQKSCTFSIYETKSTSSLEILQWFLEGIISESVGYGYYIHLVDNYPHFIWTYPLEQKFKGILTNSNSLNKSIRLGEGGGKGRVEFRSFVVFLSQIEIQFHCVHQQNGQAKRKHYHIVKLRLTLLVEACTLLSL